MYPSSTQHGAYLMHGKYQANSRILNFSPAEWLHQSNGKVVPVGLMGVVDEDGDSYVGEVMHLSCGKFHLNRTTLDVAAPAHTVNFHGADSDEPTHHMTLRAEGEIISGTPRAGMDKEDPSAGRGPDRQALQMILNGVRGLVAEARHQRQEAAASTAPASTASASTASAASAAAPTAPEPPPAQPPAAPSEATPPMTRDGAVRWRTPGMRELARMGERALAEALSARLAAGAFVSAYELWAAVPNAAVQRAAARQVLSAHAIMTGDAGGSTREQQRHMVQTLALFGGAVPSAAAAIGQVLSTVGESTDEYAFAAEQLSLALGRSGSLHADRELAEALRIADKGDEDVEDGDEMRIAPDGKAYTKAEFHDWFGDLKTWSTAQRASDGGAMQKGRQILLRLADSQPRWALPLRKLGELFRAHHDTDLAAQMLRRAVERAPHDVWSWVALGHILKERDDVRGALRAFKEAQARYPTMPALSKLRQYIAAAEKMVGSEVS